MAASKRPISHHLQILPTKDSALEARKILEDSLLNPQITTISIRASLEDVDRNITPSWDVELEDLDDPDLYDPHIYGDNGELPVEFKTILNDIGLFHNLGRVELTHDHVVEVENETGKQRESTEYRDTFFGKLLLALNNPEHPAERLHSLSICNLQESTNHDLVTSPEFLAVISRLDSLELCVVTEEDDAAPELEIELVGRHVFFGRDLQKYWLEPLQDKLVSLKIYSNCPWGYLPKCDLRGLHFPRLKSLALGNMTFTHDWQLDWIMSHGETLEVLTLDDCPIIHAAKIVDAHDSERYMPSDDTAGFFWNGKPAFWEYEARWHEYFRKLNRGLPHLRRFGVDRGPWNCGYEADHASKPFKAAALLPARLATSRYMIFHYGTGPCQWIEPESCSNDEYEKITEFEEQYDNSWDEEEPIPPPLYPDSWDEDQKALDEFLAAVESRRPKNETSEKQSLKRSSGAAGITADYKPSRGPVAIGSESEPTV